MKYSAHERVGHIEDIDHALIRRSSPVRGYPWYRDRKVADIPAGTGLGSSGSFTVGLLRAIHAHLHKQRSTRRLADEACHVEIERLADPVGKQDQYSAAFGGLTRFSFHPDDSVEVERAT